MPDITETELKFVVTEAASLRAKLLTMGAESLGRVEEFNLRFDSPDNRLKGQGAVLRLRWTDAQAEQGGVITLKLPIAGADPAFKSVREIELGVDDREAALALIEGLGYELRWRYEKRRETLRLDGLEICLDETPMGWFVELEGAPDRIRRVAGSLGFTLQEGITASYSELFAQARAAMGFSAEHLTFEALSGIVFNPALWKAGS